jgi:hypothetical protein
MIFLATKNGRTKKISPCFGAVVGSGMDKNYPGSATLYITPSLRLLRTYPERFDAHQDTTINFLIMDFNIITTAKKQYNCSSLQLKNICIIG